MCFCLKQKRQAESNLTLSVPILGRDRTECTAGRRRVWSGELNMIKGIEALYSELKCLAFGETVILEEREVKVVDAVPTYACESGRQSTDITGQLPCCIALASSIDFEPSFGCSFAAREWDVFQDAAKDRVPESQCRSTLPFEPALQLPSAGNRVQQSTGASQKLFALTERQLVDSTEDESMRKVLIRDHFLNYRIGIVEISNAFHKLRPCPAGDEHQTFA